MGPLYDALERADILGSLLRPAEHIDTAIAALQQPHTLHMDFDADDAELRRTMTMLATSDPRQLKRALLDRVASSFHAEIDQGDDVSAALFGREAAGGVRLLQLLDRTYAVVVTNPPYLGSGSMETTLKRYVESYYKPGKRDLYAAFILRCLDLARSGGRVAMITQQSWMFLRSYADLRALPQEKLADAWRKHEYTGLLRETTIESLAHLGLNGFEEISGEVVQNSMFVLQHATPQPEHRLVAFRLVGLKSGAEKARVLREAARDKEGTSY